jgi:hypothetical protein
MQNVSIKKVKSIEDICVIQFTNNQSIIFERKEPVRYQVLSPLCGSLTDYATELQTGTETGWSTNKLKLIERATKEFIEGHPIRRIEKEICSLYQKIVAPLDIRTVPVRNWTGFGLKAAITFTYPFSLPFGSLCFIAAEMNHKRRFGDEHECYPNLRQSISMLTRIPCQFIDHAIDLIHPREMRYDIGNTTALEKEGITDQPKLGALDTTGYGLPTVYFSDGTSVCKDYVETALNLRRYNSAPYFLQVSKELRESMHEHIILLDQERENTKNFAASFDKERLTSLLYRIRY